MHEKVRLRDMYSKKLISASNDAKNKYLSASKYIRETTPKLEENIIRQIETIRISEKLSVRDFCELLDMSYSSYVKIPRFERKLNLTTFLIVCRLFGYDISKLVGESYLDSADSVFRELAVFLGQLHGDTIQKIVEALSDSSEDETTKKHGEALLEALGKVIRNDNHEPLYLFTNDVPQD